MGPKLKIAVVPDFHGNFCFTDEAHFWLNGYVNKQNCRIWVKLIIKCMSKHRYIQMTAVWCALWAGGIASSKAMKATTLQSMVIDDSMCRRVIGKIKKGVIVTIDKVAAVAEWYRYRIVACLVTSSSPVPLKIRRVGQRCTLNLSRVETSSRWCGVVVRRGVPDQVSSTSLNHVSKLRGPSPKALV
ncbi:uncharacterized protein TNCV_166771 [Trichonephila clavipes]|nr:uncharacterized protein TNCV_166771 [Trichonephila clavipes]